MARRILIGTGANQTILDTRISYTIDKRQMIKPDGDTESITYIIRVSGRIVGTETQVSAGIVALDVLSSVKTPVRVEIQVNGVQEFLFQPGTSFGGPKVTAFRLLPDDGAGEFHWPFALEIFVQIGGSSSVGGGANISNIEREIEVLRSNDVLIRKTWRITVTGRSLQNALSFVRSRRPRVNLISDSITRAKDRSAVRGVFVFEASNGTIVDFIEDLPNFTPGFPTFVEVPLLGKQNPDLHLARRRSHRLIFGGIIRAIGKKPPSIGELNVPKPHFVETELIKAEAPPGLTPGEPVLRDAKLGIYEFRWAQRFRIISEKFPFPRHEGHQEPFAPNRADEPPDGNFFS